MKLRNALLAASALIASSSVLIPSAAHAQIMNYGELEDLFGEPVTTSATGSPLRRSEVPVTMDIITADDIRRSGAATIPDILARLAGIDVYTWSNQSADVAIRGLNQGASNRVMLLVNGRENYTDALGTFLWQFVPVNLDEIRQIEVIKGPNSALYGFNASGGVINIITYNPQYDDVKAERATVGSDGSLASSIVRTAHWSTGGLRVSGTWTQDPENDFHPAFAGDLPARVNPSIDRRVNIDTQQQLDESTQLRLQFAATDGALRTMYIMPVSMRTSTSMAQGDLSSETALGILSMSVMNNHYNISSFFNSLAPSGSLVNDVTVVKLQDLFKIGAADSFRIGMEYRLDDMPSYPIQGGDLSSQTAAVSGMWEHAFTKDISLLNAIRGDNFSLSRTGNILPGTFTNAQYDRTIKDWSFNSALVWRPTQLDSVRLTVARGLQLPSLTEFGVMNQLQVPFAPPFIPTATLNSVGNPNLNPTRVMQYEIGYDHQITEIDGGTRLAVYHQDVHGLRDLGQPQLVAPPPVPVMLETYVPVGNASLNGVELDVKGRLGQAWRWGANYTFEAVDSFADAYHDFRRSTPQHKFNLSLGWESGPWEAYGYLRFVTHTQMEEQVSAGVYALQDVGTVWAPTMHVAYHFTPALRAEVNAYGAFSDNAVAKQKSMTMISLVANY